MKVEDYQKVLEFGRANNPELFSDPDRLRKEMLELEQAASQEEDLTAKSIYIQGRNVLALALNEELIPEPELEIGEPQEEPIPMPERFVAIKTDSEIYGQAVKQSVSTNCNAPVKYYHGESRLLLIDILAGRIVGVIGIGTAFKVEDVRTEAVLRHSLKNLDGWDYEKAEAFPLPPVVDIAQPALLIEVIKTILEMHQGLTRPIEETQGFVLEDRLVDLRLEMLAADQAVTVTLVDDKPKEVAHLVRLLEVWPRVELHKFVGTLIGTTTTLTSQILSKNPDIVLLDEDIDEIRGTDVANSLLRQGFEGTLVSITGGVKPGFTPHHFGSKTVVGKNIKAAADFIAFMNRMIFRITRT